MFQSTPDGRATERRLTDVAKKIKHKNYRQLRGNRNAKKDNPRVVQKSIRYTPDEISYLEQASKMYQKTVAEYIRWRSLS